MNLILFSPDEIGHPLSTEDPRAVHLLRTLRRQEGDLFDAGVVNGDRLKGRISAITSDALSLAFETVETPPPLHPVLLLVGLPRPQTARKILQEATSLGVCAIHFVKTEKGESSYAKSRLWSTGEYRRHLIAGAEQAFTTRIPEIVHHEKVADALNEISPDLPGIALDNYEATGFVRDYQPPPSGCFVAVGSERGWSAKERDSFREREIPLLQLGTHVLRTETASLCALALILARLKLL
ncbi:MAG TPA: RsmE family RNA methyltransferase [Opitutales bacterium]|nr:RsmE family RNA methyltransferase [Opitutales bacterium]